MKHNHHIIPRHRGGSDAAENLVELSVKEHALWHWCEWRLWGYKYDKIAWLSLSGQITVDEAKRQAQLAGASLGGSISAKMRQEKGNTIGEWNRLTQHVKTIATTESCQKGGSVTGRMLVENGKFKEIRKIGSVVGGKASAKKLNARKFMCLDCGFESTAGGVGNHQKRTKHQGKKEVAS